MRKYLVLILLFVCFAFKGKSQSFNRVGCALPYHTTALGLYKNKLLHSGLDTNCGVGIFSIGVWNDTIWSGIDYSDPVNGSAPLQAFCTYNNQLYVGSGLYFMGNKRVNKIARWDGQDWYPMGTGLNAQFPGEHINSLVVYKGELYAAGKIIEMNGMKGVNNIARWDGSTWRKVGTGLQGSLPEVYSIAVYKDELYVGGRFLDAGGQTAYNIAKWNGTSWSAVGLGTNSDVLSLFVDTLRDLLYVGGDFNAVNNTIDADYIASWNGSNWSSMGQKTFHIDVASMEMYHGYLYAGGLSEKMMVNFARWDGNKWDSIIGLNGNVTSLQTYKDELYIGGSFTMIGADSIQYLARYYSPDSVDVGIQYQQKNKRIRLYPNPTKEKLKIESSQQLTWYEIYSILGKQIQSGKIINQEINVSELKVGMYLIKITTGTGFQMQERFVKE